MLCRLLVSVIKAEENGFVSDRSLKAVECIGCISQNQIDLKARKPKNTKESQAALIENAPQIRGVQREGWNCNVKRFALIGHHLVVAEHHARGCIQRAAR